MMAIGLRSFLLLISALVVGGTFVAVSTQTEGLLKGSFEELGNTQVKYIGQVTQTIIEGKKTYLDNFARMIGADNDLSSAFLLGNETRDHRQTAAKLQKLRETTRFDIVDLLSPRATPLMHHSPFVDSIALKMARNGERRFLITRVDRRLSLLCLRPLQHYSEIVGFVAVGYYLDGQIIRDIAEMTHASLEFLEDATPSPSATTNSFESLVRIALGGEYYLQGRIRTGRDFIEKPSQALRHGIVSTGAVGIIVLIMLLYLTIEFGFIRRFKAILTSIQDASDSLSSGLIARAHLSHKDSIREVNALSRAFERFSESLIDYDIKLRKQSEITAIAEKNAALAKLAQEVAHNIISPLTALETNIEDIRNIPEERRIAIRRSVASVRDIANNLIVMSRPGQPTSPSVQASVELLTSLVEIIVSEKRTQVRSRLGVEIDSCFGQDSYGLFAKVDPVQFKCVLSNLINNAVEAIEEKGAVSVDIHSEESRAVITISDTGKGIPEETLPQLGQYGLTMNKPGGSGVGLFHAKQTLQTWGGELTIESKLGQGTVVRIFLPLTSPPPWFLPSLRVLSQLRLVVLDDAPSIHEIWRNRLGGSRFAGNPLPIEHLFSPIEFRKWRESTPADPSHPVLYLMDFELIGYQESGLDLIETFGIGPQSVLVTSLYDDPEIQARCVRAGAKLLPKSLANLVPIDIVQDSPDSATHYDAILLDNDELIRESWAMRASVYKKKLVTLDRPDQLTSLIRTKNFDLATPIYVDSDLGDGVKGEEIANMLFKAGCSEIYLTTAYPASFFASMPWIKAVLGKKPPWQSEPISKLEAMPRLSS